MNREPRQNAKNKIIVLGGSFQTGKTTIFEQLQKDFGDRYRYIPDHAKAKIEENPLCRADIDILRHVYREAIAEQVVDEKNHDGRLTISDGSLIDIAARGQYTLEPEDFLWLNSHLMERDTNGSYVYLKFPLGIIPADVDEQVQVNQHHRVNRLLRLNPGVIVEPIWKNMQDFTARYARVLLLLRKYERLMRDGNSR